MVNHKHHKPTPTRGWYQEYKVLLITALVAFGVVAVVGIIFVIQTVRINLDKRAVKAAQLPVFNNAEIKLRQLPLPKADSTEYKRTCSFRSVKFGDPGPPNCRVSRIDIYGKENSTRELSQSIYQVLAAVGGGYNSKFSEGFELDEKQEIINDVVLDMNGLNVGLECSSGFLHTLEDEGFKLSTSCFKETKYQLFEKE